MTKEASSTERALKLALEALYDFCALGTITRPLEVCDALREALASEAIEQPAPATELREQEPVGCEGAIVNGRVYADRLEHDYKFECEAGPLHLCNDWVEFRRCFEWLAQHTSPPTLSLAQRQSRSDVKPLTDEQLRVIENKINPTMRWRSSDEEGITLYPIEYYELVRAIEAAHGIKGDA